MLLWRRKTCICRHFRGQEFRAGNSIILWAEITPACVSGGIVLLCSYVQACCLFGIGVCSHEHALSLSTRSSRLSRKVNSLRAMKLCSLTAHTASTGTYWKQWEGKGCKARTLLHYLVYRWRTISSLSNKRALCARMYLRRDAPNYPTNQLISIVER